MTTNHYFSKVQLSTSLRDYALLEKLNQQGAAYRDHALLWRLFAGDGVARDFLFRTEHDQQGHLSYYVVSQREPQPELGLLNVQSKRYAPQLSCGQWLHFDLRANPTVSRKLENKKSRRHDVLINAKMLAQQTKVPVQEAMDIAARQWLLKRAEQWGLAVRADTLQCDGYTQHRLRKNIEFSSLDYQGAAQVVDTNLLRQALLQGVGHARGFGCGLLLVKRLHTQD